MHSPSSHGRSYAKLASTLACLGALAGCATNQEPPPATAATEPQQVEVIEKSRVMALTRESPSPMPEQTSPQAATHSPTPGIVPSLQPTASESATKAEPQSDNETAFMPSDLAAATKVRDAIIDAEGLSLSARNVNVTANQGQVTLRGRVTSAAEKAHLEEVAGEAARPATLVSELQIAK
jgi:hypothetical protein